MRAEISVEDMLIHHRIAQQTTDYWADVDYNAGASAHEYFEEHGVFNAWEHRFEGREAVRDFYAWRRERGARTARHVISNFAVDVISNDEAFAHWIMCLYAADGMPIHPSEPPIMIADVEDHCIRDDQGRWLYRRRTLTPCFMGEVKPTIPPKTGAS